jgi:hypothetical protein
MNVTELDTLAAVIASTIKDATDPLLAKIADLEQRMAAVKVERGESGPAGEPGPAGKDAEPVDLAEVAKMAAALMPVPKDGQDGAPGKDAELTPEHLQEMAKAVVALMPAPRDGQDGAKGEAGEPGKDATIDLQAVATAAAALVPIPRDGRDGLTGQPGPPGRDGAKGADGLNGKDGKDGMTFTGFEAIYEPESSELIHRYTCGDEVKEYRWYLGVPRYKGIYEHGKTYEAGESVTYSGSLWITGQTTQSKPGGSDAESRAWRLAVKKGTDGKGEKGEKGEPGPQGPRGEKGENRY